MSMRKIVKVRNVELGVGIPKICVSITGRNVDEILKQATEIKENPVDIVEWRVDFFEDVFNSDMVIKALQRLADVLEEWSILFTFRRKVEGGEKDISLEDYRNLNLKVIESGLADLVDVELFAGDELVNEMIEVAHKKDVKVVVSNHDFTKTPDKEELIARLNRMQELGGDIPKIAVMPQNKKDVITLLSATEEFNREYADRPFITISMSKMGLVSRLAGGVFGSAMTFGAVGEVSAPGQIETGKLRGVLKLLGE